MDLESGEPNDQSVSGRQTAFVAVALILFVIFAVAPVVLGSWLISAIVGTVGVSEALEHTRGLHPDVYSWAFVLAAAFVATALVLELRAVFGARGDKWFWRALKRPSIGLIVVNLLTAKLVAIDVGGTDIPDVLTTTLLLVLIGWVYFIVPIALVQVSFYLSRWMWRVGTRTGFGAGAVGSLAVVFASCIPTLQCADEDDSPSTSESSEFEDAFEKAEIRAAGKGLVEGTRVGLQAFAEVIPNESEQHPPVTFRPWDAGGGQRRFEECIEELVKPVASSPSDKSIHYFAVRGMQRADAEELVQATVLEICIGHAKKPHRDILTRFRTRTHQRKKNARKKRRRRGRFECDVNTRAVLYGRSGLSADERMSLEAALCLLDDFRDREILRLTAQGFESDEIGRRLRPPLRPATVRQRRKRAINKVQKLLKEN